MPRVAKARFHAVVFSSRGVLSLRARRRLGDEPALTTEQRQRYPYKREWMDKYLGAIHFIAHPR
jgi:hypothetical protein